MNKKIPLLITAVLVSWIVFNTGCVGPGKGNVTTAGKEESREFLESFLTELKEGKNTKAIKKIVTPSGEPSKETKKWLKSEWEKTNIESFQIIEESSIPSSEVSKSPYSEGRKFKVKLQTKNQGSTASTTTTYNIVRYNGELRIMSPLVGLLEKKGKNKWPTLTDTDVAVNLDTDPWEHPKKGENLEMEIEVTNREEKTFSKDKYLIRLYYKPHKVTNVTEHGTYNPQPTEDHFTKIKTWRKTVKPSNKTQYGYEKSLGITYQWKLPRKEIDQYELRAAFEKELEGDTTEIIAWNKADVLTSIGEKKVKKAK